MKKGILIIALCTFQFVSFGQNLSLKECIDYANRNNGSIINAEYDISISQKTVNEKIGSVLPQIDASGSYTNNLKMSTTLLPGEMMGQAPGTYVPVTMGTQYNISAGVKLSQKIFDPSFGVALKAAKVSKVQKELTLEITKEQVIYNISSTYYQTLVIQKQTNTLKATMESSEKTLASTELKFKNGMAPQIDVDKIRVSYNNNKNLLQQSKLSYKQSLNTLKYYMGMPVDSIISLSDTIVDNEFQKMKLEGESLKINNHPDYQLQRTSVMLYELDKKQNTSGYLPTLSFNAAYNYEALRDEFNFFSSDDKWYSSSYINFSLNIPLFDGFQKKSKIAKSKISIEQAKQNMRMTEQSIKVDYSNYEIQFSNALDNIKNQQDNLDLAQKVYQNTQLGYQEGTSSSLDLVTAETSLREAQNNYYTELLNLYIARLSLEKSKGTLMEYINSQK